MITDKNGGPLNSGMDEQPYPQTYPQTQIQVAQNGIAVITLYSPFHMNTVVLDMNTVHEIIKVVRNHEREQNGIVDLAQRLAKGKN